MINTNGATDRARWEVMWVKDRRVIRKKFGTDLMGATQLYIKVKESGRKGATLRCCNMAFPPPQELQPRMVRGKRKGRVVEGRLVPMKKKNIEGIFWCPYCMQLRRFVKRKSFEIEGVTVRDQWFGCPMCGISHRDSAAQKWNPLLINIAFSLEEGNTRSPARTAETRRAARRRKQRRAEA